MDTLMGYAGFALGYSIIPIIAFIFGYVISKSTGKNWGYVVALIFSILFAAVIVLGTLHNNSIGG